MTHSLNGIKVFTGTRQRVERACLDLLGRGGLVFTVNALMAERARRDAAFLDVLSRADVCTADGFGVAAALALRGIECEPTPGVELGEAVATAGPVSLALIGGRAGVGERAFAYLKKKNTGLTSSFILPGYGISEETYLSAIDTHKPELCFVCLGSPRQERLAALGRDRSPRTLFLALGGSLDVYSGDKPRAPLHMRRLGLEWLWRMAEEPSRISALPSLVSYVLHVRVDMGEKSTKNTPSKPR